MGRHGTAAGIPLEVLHRIVAIASVGIDPVPHCGALVTLLAISGLTHHESYFDIAVIMGLKFFVPFLCITASTASHRACLRRGNSIQ